MGGAGHALRQAPRRGVVAVWGTSVHDMQDRDRAVFFIFKQRISL
jgi:hypothetical protein